MQKAQILYARYEQKTSEAALAFRQAKEDYETLLNSGAKKTELERADHRKQEYSAAHAAAKLQQDRFFATFQQIKHQYETAMSAAENEDLALGEVDEQTAALGMILSGAIPEDNLVLHMDAIATTASMALSSFESNVPGGDAKPEVWSNWEDFAKRMNDFAAKTANMAKVAHDEDPQTAVELAIEALDCKGCHKVYNNKRADDE